MYGHRVWASTWQEIAKHAETWVKEIMELDGESQETAGENLLHWVESKLQHKQAAERVVWAIPLLLERDAIQRYLKEEYPNQPEQNPDPSWDLYDLEDPKVAMASLPPMIEERAMESMDYGNPKDKWWELPEEALKEGEQLLQKILDEELQPEMQEILP